MVAQNVFFAVIALVMVGAALRVVTASNVVHSALYLVVVLAGAGAQYLLLTAEFVAVTQILIYVGAVMVLFLFGVMLTRAKIGAEVLDNQRKPVAALVGLMVAAVLGATLVDSFRDVELPAEGVVGRTGEVSDAIFGAYLIPFEVVSVLLLAALIAAIVVARQD